MDRRAVLAASVEDIEEFQCWGISSPAPRVLKLNFPMGDDIGPVFTYGICPSTFINFMDLKEALTSSTKTSESL